MSWQIQVFFNYFGSVNTPLELKKENINISIFIVLIEYGTRSITKKYISIYY